MALSLRTPFLSTSIVAPTRRAPKRISRPIRIKVECRKKGLHPPFYEDTKVYCDGELVLVTSGTQKELNVDTWSGKHPFYLGESMGYDDNAFFFYGYGFDEEEEEQEASGEVLEGDKKEVVEGEKKDETTNGSA